MPEPAGSREEVCRRIDRIRPELARLGVRSLALFGSAARGALKPGSDIDLVVDFAGPARFDPFMDVKELLEHSLGRRVDLITRAALKSTLRTRIEPDLVRVA